MPRAAINDNSRVALRIRTADKALIMRAVALAQTDMTAFILRTALRESPTNGRLADRSHEAITSQFRNFLCVSLVTHAIDSVCRELN